VSQAQPLTASPVPPPNAQIGARPLPLMGVTAASSAPTVSGPATPLMLAPSAPVVAYPPSDLASVESTLRTAPAAKLLDLGYGFSPEQRAHIEARLQSWGQSDGARAWVVALPRGRDVDSLKAVFGDLALHGRDTFIVMNGTMRHVHVGLLGNKEATAVLASTKPIYQRDPVEGVIAMFEAVDRQIASASAAGTTVTTPDRRAGAPGAKHQGGGTLLLALAVLVAFAASIVWYRRRNVDASLVESHRLALTGARDGISELLLSLESMPRDEAVSRALDRAGALSTQLDAVAGQRPSQAAIERLRSLQREASRMRAQVPALSAQNAAPDASA
jgi:hypothetical protein